MLFIGYLLGLEQRAEPEAGAVHVPLCRVARPRACVVVLMCPLQPPCVFWGWLCCSTWLWGAREEGSGRARAELGRCAGPQVQKAVLGELQWGDFYEGTRSASSTVGAPTLGQQTGLGALGCAWQGVRAGLHTQITLWMPFPLPTPSLMSPTSSRRDFNPPLPISAQLCTPTTATLPGSEDSGWVLGLMLGKSV